MVDFKTILKSEPVAKRPRRKQTPAPGSSVKSSPTVTTQAAAVEPIEPTVAGYPVAPGSY